MAGIGPAKAGRLMDSLAQAVDARAVLRDFKPGASAAQDWAAFQQAYERLREPGLTWPTDLDIALGWYGDQLERLFDDARVRRADLDQLLRLAPGYTSREHFLTELTLDPPDATIAESGVPLLD